MQNSNSNFSKTTSEIKSLFSLFEDKASNKTIDQRVRSDIRMKGSNLWVLMFAIFIASVGLNVNSTAVVIGAMLISPLMGPIVGIGYGAGVQDFLLVRDSFKNIVIAVAISVVTSFVYFFISPITIAQPEIVSRTMPTIWDVLIALFGGLAGIIALTREEKNNVVPGVAIATALMPPLCTAGFGLANGKWDYFFGAMYLFIINFVFIAMASYWVVKIFVVRKRSKEKEVINTKKTYLIMLIALVLTILPSSYLAYTFVAKEKFKTEAYKFVNKYFDIDSGNVAQVKVDTSKKIIQVYLIGKHIDDDKIDQINLALQSNMKGSTLKVYQDNGIGDLDINAIKSGIITDMHNTPEGTLIEKYQELIESKDRKIRSLQNLEVNYQNDLEYFQKIPQEAQTAFPKILKSILSTTSKTVTYSENNATKTVQERYYILNITSVKSGISSQERERIKKWLQLRVESENALVYVR